MIVKLLEIEKNIANNKFFLFYGQNQGYKNQVIEEKFKKNTLGAFTSMKKMKF